MYICILYMYIENYVYVYIYIYIQCYTALYSYDHKIVARSLDVLSRSLSMCFLSPL